MSIDINPNDPGSPLDPLPGHSSRGRLERILRRGEFVYLPEQRTRVRIEPRLTPCGQSSQPCRQQPLCLMIQGTKL